MSELSSLRTRVRAKATELGFKVDAKEKNSDLDPNGIVLLLPRKGKLPLCDKETPIAEGTFEELEWFLNGALWSRNYDDILSSKKHENNGKGKITAIRESYFKDLLDLNL